MKHKGSQGKHEPSTRSTHFLNSKKSQKAVRKRNISHQLEALTS
jgi:hypothetical protein